MVKGELRTPENAAIILEHLRNGLSVCEIATKIIDCEESAIRQWVVADAEFATEYAEARKLGYEHMADELLEVADNGSNDWMERNNPDCEGWVQNGEALGRSRLRVDTRKWLLSKCLPKVYGEVTRVIIDAKTDAQVRDFAAWCASQNMTREAADQAMKMFMGE